MYTIGHWGCNVPNVDLENTVTLKLQPSDEYHRTCMKSLLKLVKSVQ